MRSSVATIPSGRIAGRRPKNKHGSKLPHSTPSASFSLKRLVLGGCILALAGCGASIHDTVARGKVEEVEAMLVAAPERVDDRNELGKTALHYAVRYKRMDIMERLVAKGADVDTADRTGMTPLHEAALLGRREEAAWLLAQGASVETRDRFGDTPLLTAAIFGQGGVLKELVDHGAPLEDSNAAGHGALALAQQHRRGKAARYIARLLRQARKG